MKVLINYADDTYKSYQKFNSRTGLHKGKFDKVIQYSPADLDPDFVFKNRNILKIKRGAGLWLWKPYIILKTLHNMEDDTYIFYCDSGSYFVASIDHLIACMENDKREIMTFETPLLNIQFSKSGFIKSVSAASDNIDEWLYSNQVLGGFILVKNNSLTRKIIAEFLALCEQEELILSPSDELQHSSFIAHREDQTILSYLMWKHKIKPYRDPSQYGEMPLDYIKYGVDNSGLCYGCFKKYNNSPFPAIIRLYRKKKVYQLLPRLRFKAALFIKKYFFRKAIQIWQ